MFKDNRGGGGSVSMRQTLPEVEYTEALLEISLYYNSIEVAHFCYSDGDVNLANQFELSKLPATINYCY